MSAAIIDMAGQRFSSVVVVVRSGKSASGDLKWHCRCDCGSEFDVNGYYLRSGKVVSCKKCSAERVRLASVKHELSATREFAIWTGMQTRCYNKRAKAYPEYGGRGVVMCERWLASFTNFLADMGKCPQGMSIDRIDVNGNYEPENCRWATTKEQNSNKRNNVWVEINGVKKTLSDWCVEFNVLIGTASLRHKKGLRGMDLFKSTAKQITLNGVTDSVFGWSKRTGIKATTISMRINKYKWSIEDALNKGELS